MASGFTAADAALLDELGVEFEPKEVARHTAREERIIAGFEEIQRFVDRHGRAPEPGEDRDFFERLYAARLDRIKDSDECRTILAPVDRQKILGGGVGVAKPFPDDVDDDALLAELGVQATTRDITELRHVRSSAEKQASEEIASRTRCEDFERFARSLTKFRRRSPREFAIHGPLSVRPRSSPAASSSWVARKPTSLKWDRCSHKSTGTQTLASA